MSPLVSAIANGSLEKKGVIVSPPGQPFYVLEYLGEKAGVFARFGLMKYYSYSELERIEGKIKRTVPATGTFAGVAGLNDFFSRVLDHNFKIAQAGKAASLEAVDPGFITAIYSADGKGGALSPVQENLYLVCDDSREKHGSAQNYFRSQQNALRIRDQLSALSRRLETFITQTLIAEAPGAREHSLALLDHLKQEVTILDTFKSIATLALDLGEEPLNFSGVVEKALAGTRWKATEPVNLNESPVVHLAVKG